MTWNCMLVGYQDRTEFMAFILLGFTVRLRITYVLVGATNKGKRYIDLLPMPLRGSCFLLSHSWYLTVIVSRSIYQ